MHLYMYAHEYEGQRTISSVGFLLLFETGFFSLDLKLTASPRLFKLVSFRDPFVPVFPALGLKTSSTMPIFYVGAELPN